LRTVFLGSPPFATPVLARLLGSRHRPSALVTRPDRPRGRGRSLESSPLVELARGAGLEVLQPADPQAPEVLERLRALAPQVLFVASYGVILKPALLELAPHGALNAHASLLPRHRGASPIQAALLAGDAETGVSIQRIVAELDAGDVLLERRIAIPPEATAGELFGRLAELAGEAAVEALDRLESGSARFTPQDPARVTHARKLRKQHGLIDWSRPAPDLARFVRAMTPWPGARTQTSDGRELTLLAVRALEGPGAPGSVLEAGPRLVVGCGAGALELLELAPAGKRAMSAAEWLRGARLALGDRLGGAQAAPGLSPQRPQG
jgi:methionyl-tRNA formyltransferase